MKKKLDLKKFKYQKEKAEKFYKDLNFVNCPYFSEKVYFNSKGLEHLKFKKKHHARNIEDQFIRFKLLHLAPEVLRLSKTVQGISYRKNFEIIRSNNRNERKLVEISFFEFIAVLNNLRIRIIVKQIENSPKFFWSIIPFWKMNKNNQERKLFQGNLEED